MHRRPAFMPAPKAAKQTKFETRHHFLKAENARHRRWYSENYLHHSELVPMLFKGTTHFILIHYAVYDKLSETHYICM